LQTQGRESEQGKEKGELMTTKIKTFTCKKGYWYFRMKGEQVNCGHENKEINAGSKPKRIKFKKIKELTKRILKKKEANPNVD
jgi:hypothetical protein